MRHNSRQSDNNNRLLTECEGRTGEYWPKVVAVQTSLRLVRTKTTEGQYSTLRLEQARLVSSLLYGTLYLIVKCTFGGLHLKMFVFSIYLWNFKKNFQSFYFLLIVSMWRMTLFTLFFGCFGCKFWICRLRSKTKIHEWQNPDWKRTNQSTGFCLRLGLPYNNY